MPKKKMLSDFDLHVSNKKLKSCFNFQKDLALGTVGEEYIKSIFADEKIKLEVKKDDWTTRSGNVAIEFESRGKPSGIEVTKADFWCHVIGHFFIISFPVDFLRQVCNKLKNESRYVKSIGDRDANGNPVSKAVLLPWTELLSLFKAYKPS
jgi:hypothetical protein